MTQYDRDKLVTDNMRLVYHLYEKLTKNPLTENYKDDIVSSGMLGLVKAANAFDEMRGVKFSTYAARCITNEMLMFIRRMNRQVPHEVSLYAPVGTDEKGHTLCYADILECDGDCPEKAIASLTVESFIRKQSETDREIIDALRQGYKQREIADMLGVKQSTVSRKIRRIKQRYEKEEPF